MFQVSLINVIAHVLHGVIDDTVDVHVFLKLVFVSVLQAVDNVDDVLQL